VARWGHLDIGGNVWEFTLDSFADYVVPCIDCVNETAQQFRIERGGSFTDTAAALVPPFRGYGFSSAFDENGMRCARTP
jgi:formylglycine-generating enzyme required for sulfatase activity